MPSRTRCGSLSSTLRSINAPGSPSSALQITNFCVPTALATEHLAGIRRSDVFVHLPFVRRYQRAFRTQPHASNALHLAVFSRAALGDIFRECIFDCFALTREAACCNAHAHLMHELLLLVA